MIAVYDFIRNHFVNKESLSWLFTLKCFGEFMSLDVGFCGFGNLLRVIFINKMIVIIAL